jgi:hypothetical protein
MNIPAISIICIGVGLIIAGAVSGIYEVLGVGIVLIIVGALWLCLRKDSTIDKISLDEISRIILTAKCITIKTINKINYIHKDIVVCEMQDGTEVMIDKRSHWTRERCIQLILAEIPIKVEQKCFGQHLGQYYMVYRLTKTDGKLSKLSPSTIRKHKQEIKDIIDKLIDENIYCEIKSLDDIEFILNEDDSIKTLVLSRIETLRPDDVDRTNQARYFELFNNNVFKEDDNATTLGLDDHIHTIINNAQCTVHGDVSDITSYENMADVYICKVSGVKVMVDMRYRLDMEKCAQHVKLVKDAMKAGISLNVDNVCYDRQCNIVYKLKETNGTLNDLTTAELKGLKGKFNSIIQKLHEHKLYCEIKSLDDIEFIRNANKTITLMLSRVETLQLNESQHDYRIDQFGVLFVDDELP